MNIIPAPPSTSASRSSAPSNIRPKERWPVQSRPIERNLVLVMARIAVQHAGGHLDVERLVIRDRPPLEPPVQVLRELTERVREQPQSHEPLSPEPALVEVIRRVQRDRLLVIVVGMEMPRVDRGLEIPAVGAPRLGCIPRRVGGPRFTERAERLLRGLGLCKRGAGKRDRREYRTQQHGQRR